MTNPLPQTTRIMSKIDKARRLIVEGKVQVMHACSNCWYALVEGDTGTYLVGDDPAGRHCECVSGRHRGPNVECSHYLAARVAADQEMVSA